MFAESGQYRSFGGRVAVILDSGRITDQKKDTLVAYLRQTSDIQKTLVDWRLVELETGCVDNVAFRSTDAQGCCIGNRIIDFYPFDFKWADLIGTREALVPPSALR